MREPIPGLFRNHFKQFKWKHFQKNQGKEDLNSDICIKNHQGNSCWADWEWNSWRTHQNFEKVFCKARKTSNNLLLQCKNDQSGKIAVHKYVDKVNLR